MASLIRITIQWIALAAAALYLSTPGLLAQAPAWESTGPWAGTVMAFGRVDGAILAATLTTGTFRSVDDGHTWERLNAMAAPGFATHGSTILAFGGLASSRSTDRGTTWTRLDVAPSAGMAFVGDTLIAVERGGPVAISTDLGDTWHTGAAVPADGTLNVVATGHTIYAGGLNGLFASTNAGASWHQLPSISEAYCIQTLCVSGDTVVIAGRPTQTSEQDHVYRSVDGGVNWEPLRADLPPTPVTALAIADGVILAACSQYGGLQRWTDDDRHWTGVAGSGTADFAAIAATDGAVLAGYGLYRNAGIIRSTDAGATWSPANDGFSTLSIRDLAADGATILASAPLYGLFRSTDYGTTWADIRPNLPAHGSIDIAYVDRISAVAASDGALMVGVTYAGFAGESILRSTDGGVTWAPVIEFIHSIIEFATSGTEIVAISDGALYRTTNAGADWRTIEVPRAVKAFDHVVMHGTDLVVFAGTEVHRSSDSGMTWTKVGTFGAQSATAAYSDGRTMIAGTSGEQGVPPILRSTDGGATWITPSAGLPIGAVTAIAGADGYVFAASNAGAIYRSGDGGDHWTMWISSPDGAGPIRRLSASATRLVAGTSFRGVFRTATVAAVAERRSAVSDLSIVPDPTTGSAILTYSLPRPGTVAIDLFDALGRAIGALQAREMNAGTHVLPIDLTEYPAGLYHVRITTEQRTTTQRIIVVR